MFETPFRPAIAARVACAAIALLAICASEAWADPIVVDVGSAPVINVQLRTGTLNVQTWNRNQVQIQSAGTVDWHHVSADIVARNVPQQIPAVAQTIQTAQGEATLPFERFVLPPLGNVSHDAVTVRGEGDTTVLIPSGTALLVTHVGRGATIIQDYRDGVFFAAVGSGEVALRNLSGTGFVQALRGAILVSDSSFERLRARSAQANMLFEGCMSHQIEATSVLGSIVYDNGSFKPGLARFETQAGNVALGVAGGAQIGAHSSVGRIFSTTGGRDVVPNQTDAQTSFGGGGATVTATSARGAVMLYDGSMRNHQRLAGSVPQLRAFFQRRARAIGAFHSPAFGHTNPQQRNPYPRIKRPRSGRPPR